MVADASQPKLTRNQRLQVTQRLDEAAAYLDDLADWLDRFGDDCDKASVILECGSRDCRAAAWIIKPADHTRPEGWLSRSNRGWHVTSSPPSLGL